MPSPTLLSLAQNAQADRDGSRRRALVAKLLVAIEDGSPDQVATALVDALQAHIGLALVPLAKQVADELFAMPRRDATQRNVAVLGLTYSS